MLLLLLLLLLLLHLLHTHTEKSAGNPHIHTHTHRRRWTNSFRPQHLRAFSLRFRCWFGCLLVFTRNLHSIFQFYVLGNGMTSLFMLCLLCRAYTPLPLHYCPLPMPLCHFDVSHKVTKPAAKIETDAGRGKMLTQIYLQLPAIFPMLFQIFLFFLWWLVLMEF